MFTVARFSASCLVEPFLGMSYAPPDLAIIED